AAAGIARPGQAFQRRGGHRVDARGRRAGLCRQPAGRRGAGRADVSPVPAADADPGRGPGRGLWGRPGADCLLRSGPGCGGRTAVAIRGAHRSGPGGDQSLCGQGDRRTRHPAAGDQRRAYQRRAGQSPRAADRDRPSWRSDGAARALGNRTDVPQPPGHAREQGAGTGGQPPQPDAGAAPPYRAEHRPHPRQPGRSGGAAGLSGEAPAELVSGARIMIQRLLIANRGEIACRIIRTARAMGIDTVAVYSTVDRRARHVQEADMAMALSGARPSESYLDMTQLLDAARASGADAIHPGYGFLSENPAFARAVAEAGLTLIGPPASAIEAMGDKAAAKALMAQAGVPLVPGYHGTDQSPAAFARAAEQIGFPILLKASAGGGGKGMKIVERADELTAAIESARREALAAFGDDRL